MLFLNVFFLKMPHPLNLFFCFVSRNLGGLVLCINPQENMVHFQVGKFFLLVSFRSQLGGPRKKHPLRRSDIKDLGRYMGG